MIAATWAVSVAVTYASLSLKDMKEFAWTAIVFGLLVFIVYVFIIRKVKKTSRMAFLKVQDIHAKVRKAKYNSNIIRDRSVIASSLAASITFLVCGYPWAIFTLAKGHSFWAWMLKNCFLALKPTLDSIQYFLAPKWKQLLR